MSKKPKYKRIIKQVIKNKTNNQLMVTVPSNCGISEGDYVEIVPLVIKRFNTKNLLLHKENVATIDDDGNLVLKENEKGGENKNE